MRGCLHRYAALGMLVSQETSDIRSPYYWIFSVRAAISDSRVAPASGHEFTRVVWNHIVGLIAPLVVHRYHFDRLAGVISNAHTSPKPGLIVRRDAFLLFTSLGIGTHCFVYKIARKTRYRITTIPERTLVIRRIRRRRCATTGGSLTVKLRRRKLTQSRFSAIRHDSFPRTN